MRAIKAFIGFLFFALVSTQVKFLIFLEQNQRVPIVLAIHFKRAIHDTLIEEINNMVEFYKHLGIFKNTREVRVLKNSRVLISLNNALCMFFLFI